MTSVKKQIKYRGCPLRVVGDEEDVRHLGFWATPNGNWEGMVDRAYVSTMEAIQIVHHSTKVVSPSAGANLFNSLAVSVFRHSEVLIPWGRHDLGVDTLPAQLDKLLVVAPDVRPSGGVGLTSDV